MQGNRQLKKVIRGNHKLSQIVLALFGCMMGFFLILISAQCIINYNAIFHGSRQGIGAQYMVLNKRISLLGSISNSNSSFTERELEELSNHPSIKNYSAFEGNQFEAHAFLEFKDMGQAISIKTDLFLESVKDEFIDVELNEWTWNESDSVIPIILPSDFINLYNFTYAPARGLPQLSKSTIKFFSFNINVNGRNENSLFKAKIVGFSDRITSLVVPMSFIRFANRRFGDGLSENGNGVYRIIAEVSPEKLAEFHKFILDNNYEANEELLRNAKFVSLLYIVLSIIFFVGSLITLNAFTGFILYYNLIIYRSKEDIDSLLRLGYSHHKLVMNYLWSVTSLLLSVVIIALIGLIWFQRACSSLLSSYNFDIPEAIGAEPVVLIIFFVMVLLFLFYLLIRREIYGIALPKLYNRN